MPDNRGSFSVLSFGLNFYGYRCQSYPGHFHQIYRAFHRQHVPVDIVAPTGDLSKYKLVIAPALHIVPEAVAENLRRFVTGGGVLVVTPRSGVKDEANAVVNQRLPGLLAELCGVEVEEYDSLAPDMGNEIEFSMPELASCSPVPADIWCDVLQPNGAEVAATYAQQFYAGRPAITLNQFGKGKAVYVGVLDGAALYEALGGWLLGLAGVQPVRTAPEGVEVAERWQGDRRLLFVLNHSDEEQEIMLGGSFANLLNGESIGDSVAIAPKDVLVLTEA